MLARAYMQSREWDKSIAPLTKAAEQSDEGKFYAQLAQSYIQNENWKAAESSLTKALDKGGLDDEANSWLLLGIARTRLEKFDAAIKAFRKAGDDDDVAKDAFRWIALSNAAWRLTVVFQLIARRVLHANELGAIDGVLK